MKNISTKGCLRCRRADSEGSKPPGQEARKGAPAHVKKSIAPSLNRPLSWKETILKTMEKQKASISGRRVILEVFMRITRLPHPGFRRLK